MKQVFFKRDNLFSSLKEELLHPPLHFEKNHQLMLMIARNHEEPVAPV